MSALLLGTKKIYSGFDLLVSLFRVLRSIDNDHSSVSSQVQLLRKLIESNQLERKRLAS